MNKSYLVAKLIELVGFEKPIDNNHYDEQMKVFNKAADMLLSLKGDLPREKSMNPFDKHPGSAFLGALWLLSVFTMCPYIIGIETWISRWPDGTYAFGIGLVFLNLITGLVNGVVKR